MAKKTIIKKWAEDTHNKYELSEEQVKTGIVRLGNIVSNQLNAVANRADTMIDLLQRCSAWNADKTYQQGDLCMVSVYYKRPSDAQHKYYIMFLLSIINDNTEIPLINNGAVSFTRNDDLTTPCFTITANSEIILSNFVNGTGWVFADSTCGDLTNCVNLSVSDLAHFKGNTSFDGNVVANSNINLAGNLTTQGHLELAGTANFNNSVTLNGLVNTATTPPANATGNEIITAKWAREIINQRNNEAYPPYAYMAEKDFTLKELEETEIELKIPSSIFYFVSGFLFLIYEVKNDGSLNLVYTSKQGLEINILENNFYHSFYQNLPKLGSKIKTIYEPIYPISFPHGTYDHYTGRHKKNGVWEDILYDVYMLNLNQTDRLNIINPLRDDFIYTELIIRYFTRNSEYGENYKIFIMLS